MYSVVRWKRHEIAAKFPDARESLEVLNLSDFDLAGPELTGLQKDGRVNRSILELNLGFNHLTSLECVAGFTGLVKLEIGHNRLESLEGLEGLVNLKVLKCAHNKLKSLDGLANCKAKGLEILDVSCNEITSIGNGLRGFNELGYLHIYGNPCAIEFEELRTACKQSLIGATVVTLDFETNRPRSFCLREEIEILHQEENQDMDVTQDLEIVKHVLETIIEKIVSENEHKQQQMDEITRDSAFKIEGQQRVNEMTTTEDPETVTHEDDEEEQKVIPVTHEDDEEEQKVIPVTHEDDGEKQKATTVTNEDEAEEQKTIATQESVVFRDDGSCTVRWPNGSMAISIEKVGPGQAGFRTLAMNENGLVVASFDDQGSGSLNFDTGKTFLSIASSGCGLTMTSDGQLSEVFNIHDSKHQKSKSWTMESGPCLEFKVELLYDAGKKKGNQQESSRKQTILKLTTIFRCGEAQYKFTNGFNSVEKCLMLTEKEQKLAANNSNNDDGDDKNEQENETLERLESRFVPRKPVPPARKQRNRKKRPTPTFSSIISSLETFNSNLVK